MGELFQGKSGLSSLTSQQAEQERLVGAIAQRIRHTLDLNDLVTTAAQELGKLLPVDRVEIVRYLPDEHLWRHLAEYRRSSKAPSFMTLDMPDQNNPLAEHLKQFESVQINNPQALFEDDEINSVLAQLAPGFWLLLPLKTGKSLWGSLSLVKHESGWDATQIELLQAAADQLMIAIEHSQLYQQVQQLNGELERTVRQRTKQLYQALASESMLKRITDKVRDSLDETHILETVVEELSTLFELTYCGAGLYNPAQNTCTIADEHTVVLPSMQGRVVEMAIHHCEIYEQLLSCQHLQCCLLQSDLYPFAVGHLLLACPIFDNQGVLGDLWLFRPGGHLFNELEVRLVQQVTSQCAIAIRQARLYQTCQHQVENLEHINQLKDNFLSTISHELRTPISTMKMAIQMLTLMLGREGLLPDPAKPSLSSNKIAHYLKILNDECNREITLITDLLDLQQLEAGTHSLTVQPIDLSTYLSRILRPFHDQAKQQGQTLNLDIAADLPTILSDPQSLERILVELLTNACKYTPVGECIHVIAQTIARTQVPAEPPKKGLFQPSFTPPTPYFVQISVTNTGIEILPEQLGQVFDKFYRIPNHDPHRHGGTGLGLALVKKLVLQLGGQISAESEQGRTRFTVKLPGRAG